MRFNVCTVIVGGVSAYTSVNSPSAPGNWNFPTEASVFGAQEVKNLPDINVRFHYPAQDAGKFLADAEDSMNFQSRLAALKNEQQYDAQLLKASFLKKGGEDAAYSAMSNVAAQSVPSYDAGFEMLLGLAHSPRPHVHAGGACVGASCRQQSFLKVDPLEILPPGIATGIVAKASDRQPYTLNLMAPEEGNTNTMVDSIYKIERSNEKSIEALSIANKQRLLNAEISKVRNIVRNARKSFLRKSADYEIDLHPPTESKSQIDADVNTILKTIAARSASEGAADAALKAQLLAAEIGKIRAITAGAH